MKRLPCPEPGIHYGIPAAEYHAWDALSCGTLLEGRMSMRQLRYAMDHPKEETPAMRLGSLTDSAILEPAEFMRSLLPESEWPINPTTKKPYGSDSQKFKDFCAENPGRIALGKGEADDILGMIAATQEDSDNAKRVRASLFAPDRVVQASVVFDAKTTAGLVRFKCRPDLISQKLNLVVDLKTARPLPFHALGDYQWKLGMYHRAVMYRRGLAAVGLGGLEWMWTIVDNEPPYDVQIFPPEPAGTIAAEAECDDLLRRYAECVKSGRWPGKNETMQTPPIPQWVINRAMHEEANRAAFAEAGE